MTAIRKVETGVIVKNPVYGPYIIKEDLGIINNRHKVLIEFLKPNMYGFNTNLVVPLSNIRDSHNIKDPYQPDVCGVACRGIVEDNNSIIHKYLSDKWRAAVARCYNPANPNYYKYGAVGVTMCYRWLCFEYFNDDAPSLSGYDEFIKNPAGYDIDKDIKQGYLHPNDRVRQYNPDTTIFAPHTINMAQATYDRDLVNPSDSQYNTEYIGVHKLGESTYACVFHGKSMGRFNNIFAAASLYNWLAIDSGYPKHLINDLGDNFMDIADIHKYKIDVPFKKHFLYRSFRDDNDSNIDRILKPIPEPHDYSK